MRRMAELFSGAAVDGGLPMRSRRPVPVLPSRRATCLTRPALAILWLAAGLLGAPGAGEATLGATPLGSQFQVNTYTTDYQFSASVACAADGDFVVVWTSAQGASYGSWESIQGQRYNLSGGAVGEQFQVNTFAEYTQWFPSVAADRDGNFVVVWQNGGSMSGPWPYSIQGRRYDASGNPVGSEFQINTLATGGVEWPSVAVDRDGDFVVVWHSDHSAGSDTSGSSIQGRRYDASGNAVGSEFQVNTYTTGSQIFPSVAANADGDFVVVWGSWGSAGSDTSVTSIQGQRYDASGNAIGSEFQVNTYTTDTQWSPSVAVDAGGNIMIVWQSDGSAGSDTLGYSVQGQRYDASGNAVGTEFQVNTYTTDTQWSPSVAFDADGNSVVVWTSDGSTGSDSSGHSIQGQRYDASGNAVGAEFQVNRYTTDDQGGASVAVDARGDFVVVWQSDGSPGDDTFASSIQGQRFGDLSLPALLPTGLVGLALLLLGAGAAALRGTLRERG